MPASKIQDEQEVIRWFAEGRTYEWMVNEYRRKYDIETVSSMWGNFRRRRGLARRIARDDDLIPWAVAFEHRHTYPLQMLRVVARQRAGFELRDVEVPRLENWLAMLADRDVVVHYEPDSVDGFSYVPREPGDDDIIRRPLVKTTARKAAD